MLNNINYDDAIISYKPLNDGACIICDDIGMLDTMLNALKNYWLGNSDNAVYIVNNITENKNHILDYYGLLDYIEGCTATNPPSYYLFESYILLEFENNDNTQLIINVMDKNEINIDF